ncbi:hypothetical protein GQ457_11G027810 [Hibiscus cannabinus]
MCDGTDILKPNPSCGRPLGMALHHRTRRLYVCDAFYGFGVLGPKGGFVTQLSTTADGEPFRFCNAIYVHQPTGNVYFTDASSAYDITQFQTAVSVNDSTGRLLKYDVENKQVTLLFRNLSFAAGVAVDKAEKFALVSEFIGNKTRKIWLQQGHNKHYRSEIVNSLPTPDNIKRTRSDDFWLAAARTDERTESSLLPLGVRINGNGNVLETVNLERWYGNKSVSEVEEFGSKLYIASRLIMFLLSIFVSNFPSMALSEIFRTIQLPPTATGPESMAFELATGRFYVGVADGRILQYNGLTGFVEYGFTGGNRSKALCDGITNPDLGRVCGRPFGLGLHYATNQLYVCDAYLGLMVLGSGTGGRLATPVSVGVEGVPYRFCNGLDVHQLSGNVFFSDSTTAYDFRDAEKGSASNDSTGRLLMYNPNTRRVTVLLKNLPGPSGVAVSQDGSYVLVSNYNANNTIKFWLMGPRADTYDIVNTQARPNNIQRTLMGDYWQAAAMVKQSTQTLVPIGQRINSFGNVIQTANFERWQNERQQYCGVVLKQLRSQRPRKHQSRISAQIFPAAAEGRISRKGEIASEYSRIFLKEARISGWCLRFGLG